MTQWQKRCDLCRKACGHQGLGEGLTPEGGPEEQRPQRSRGNPEGLLPEARTQGTGRQGRPDTAEEEEEMAAV